MINLLTSTHTLYRHTLYILCRHNIAWLWLVVPPFHIDSQYFDVGWGITLWAWHAQSCQQSSQTWFVSSLLDTIEPIMLQPCGYFYKGWIDWLKKTVNGSDLYEVWQRDYLVDFFFFFLRNYILLQRVVCFKKRCQPLLSCLSDSCISVLYTLPWFATRGSVHSIVFVMVLQFRDATFSCVSAFFF